VAGRPSKLTEEVAKRILSNFRQGGRLIYAAARQGVSRSTLFSWLKRGERESSGPYHGFSRAVALVGEERIVSLALRHHRLATGCVMELPARDKSGRVRGDAKGEQIISHVAFRPNSGAMEWELKRLDPDTYDVGKVRLSEAIVPEEPMSRQQCALPREPVGGLTEQGMTADEIDSGRSHMSRGRGLGWSEPLKLDSQADKNWTGRWAYRRIGHGSASQFQFRALTNA
jgi:hypothetical protein